MAQVNTCSRCGHGWTGLAVAHCSACCSAVGGPRATFSSPGLFDKHRTARGDRGTCLDPATLVKEKGVNDGDPIMFHRDGMWRGPELTEAQKLSLFGVAS